MQAKLQNDGMLHALLVEHIGGKRNSTIPAPKDSAKSELRGIAEEFAENITQFFRSFTCELCLIVWVNCLHKRGQRNE